MVVQVERPMRIGDLLLQRGLITEAQLQKALEHHRKTGERMGRIFISLDMVKRWDLYQLLAEQWNLDFVNLFEVDIDSSFTHRFDEEDLVRYRMIPYRYHAGSVYVATAEKPNNAMRDIIHQKVGYGAHIQFEVTTEWDIDQKIREIFSEHLLDRAIQGLYYRDPMECAYTVLTKEQFYWMVGGIMVLLVLLFLFPQPTLIAINLVINLGFLISILFKFVVSLAGARYEQVEQITQEEIDALNDDELPIYTILVPVYKEASIVAMLMENLGNLDYPASKLEILLLLEEDDEETQTAARAAKPPENITFVITPERQPKTKPKACNVGLFFAKGEYLVIYDAEDKPDRDQLKKAVVAFRKGDEEGRNLACVQAALNYFNRDENFFTRMFTLEYSYWFDYMLPGLDSLKLPIPLGGTSNHFKTDVLRQLGGWDPFNVTEDADLGIRASANGYTVGIINSTTYEEANNAARNWIRQRSRWIKGYMQTALVHLRNPLGLVRKVGWTNALGFLFLIGGTPFVFLAFPPMLALFVVGLLVGAEAMEPFFPPLVLYLSMFNLLFGNAIMVYLNMLAVFKRGYYDLFLYALLNPFYWTYHSRASYMALKQLFTKPFFWEKTNHGISSHLPTNTQAASSSH